MANIKISELPSAVSLNDSDVLPIVQTTTKKSTFTLIKSFLKTYFDTIYSSKLLTFNRQTASYTLVLGDASKVIEMNVGSANNLTVPPNSNVAFDVGTEIVIMQYGAGQTTIVAGSGVTLRSISSALKISGQYAGVSLLKVGTNEWYVLGALTN